MTRFRKGYNLRSVFLVIVGLFLFNTLLYAASFSLRVPLDDYGRMRRILLQKAEQEEAVILSEIGEPGSEKRKDYYMALAQYVHEALKHTGALCKRHSAVIVEMLFKEYGVRAAIMETTIGKGAHYWVETEDFFIIDAFILGHGHSLLKRGEDLGNKDIIIISKQGNDGTENRTIEEFYSNGVYFYEVTELLLKGGLSAVEEIFEILHILGRDL